MKKTFKLLSIVFILSLTTTLLVGCNSKKENEIISGIIGGYIDYKEALNKILSFLMISEEDIEKNIIVTLYHQDQNEENKMVYLLTISFNKCK